jgi:hypothetical protein
MGRIERNKTFTEIGPIVGERIVFNGVHGASVTKKDGG